MVEQERKDAYAMLAGMGEPTSKLWFSASLSYLASFPERFFTSKADAQAHADAFNAAYVKAGGKHPGYRALSFEEVEAQVKDYHRQDGAESEYRSQNGY